MKIRIAIVVMSAVVIFCFGVYQYFVYSQKQLVVVFCNVGQGDGIYIRTPSGVDVVVDAGPDASMLRCLARHMPIWDRNIELVFATHPDADHIGGFKYILDSYSVDLYNTSDAEKDTGLFKLLSEKLKGKNISVRELILGDSFKLGDNLTLTTQWPTREFLKIGDADSNRYSLVQMLNFYNFNILLTGDADFDIVDGVITSINKKNISIEIFKLPHHGSRTGVGPQTFTYTKPVLSIISAEKDNRYGHPHKEVLTELGKYKLKFLETKNGDIKITTNGSTWKVEQ